MNLCPRCESKGRSITPVTLEAQVAPTRLDQLAEHDGWRLCTSESCEVVYFRDGEVVVLGQTRGVPFHKSEDPQRLVCFCFEHSVADIEADVAQNGASTIQASIKAECKAGRDDCERKNPQGRCCLGDVGQVVKRAAPGDADGRGADCCEGEAAEAQVESCCAPKTTASDSPPATADTTARSGLFASGGALATLPGKSARMAASDARCASMRARSDRSMCCTSLTSAVAAVMRSATNSSSARAGSGRAEQASLPCLSRVEHR